MCIGRWVGLFWQEEQIVWIENLLASNAVPSSKSIPFGLSTEWRIFPLNGGLFPLNGGPFPHRSLQAKATTIKHTCWGIPREKEEE